MPMAAQAGAWTLPVGGYYLTISAAALSTDQVFDADGERVDYISALSPGTYQERQLRAYAEYGLAPRVTLVASTSFQWLEVREEGVIWKTWGLSDIRIGTRYGLPTGDLVSALAVEVKIPSGYDDMDFPSLGNGDPEMSLGLQAGRSFGRIYLVADAGYNLRAGALDNEITWSLEAGWQAANRLGLRTNLRSRSVPGTSGGDPLLDPTRVDSQSLKLGGALTWSATKQLGIEASTTHTLSGRQTLAGTEAAFALVWHR